MHTQGPIQEYLNICKGFNFCRLISSVDTIQNLVLSRASYLRLIYDRNISFIQIFIHIFIQIFMAILVLIKWRQLRNP